MTSIDILIPFWGDPDLLLEAIGSVRAQTDQQWQLTVVDDCYPDTTVAGRVNALGDPRIRYLRNEHNLGITENYRRCVSLATAERLVMFGCDDIMLPSYVATIKRAASQFPHAAIIQPGVEAIDEHGAPSRSLVDTFKRLALVPRNRRPTTLEGEPAAVSLLRGDWLYWPSLAFRREDLQRVDFRDDFPIIQDLGIIIDLILAGGSLVYYPELVFQYRRHSASASSSTIVDGSRFEGERRYFALAAQLMRERGWKKAERVARHQVISRLHALTLLPGALIHRYAHGARVLARHAFGPPTPRP